MADEPADRPPGDGRDHGTKPTAAEIDSVTLEILRNQLEGVAEEMGRVLIRGAFSANIKERQDCSTALFDSAGRMVAQAEHIPVHLGAMPVAVDAVKDQEPEPGDVWVLNDPFRGGTHLPDVTMVSPVDRDGEIIAYAVSRAHHADVGGMAPGSMPANSTEIYQEGIRIPPTRLVDGGERIDEPGVSATGLGDVNEQVFDLLLANVRTPDERRADIRAQIAANRRASRRVGELVAEHGRERLEAAFDAVIAYSRDRIKAAIAGIPDGTYRAADAIEGDGQTEDDIPVRVAVTVDGETVHVDFDGTAPQAAGNVNAPLAVTKSAVYFVVRCVTEPEIPPNHGCYEPVVVSVPTGSVLNPSPPAAVVAGNVETSQRVTDTVLAAFAEALPDTLPAESQGTMNTLIIGSRTADGFTYVETIGGGFGARPTKDGIDGVHVGMTNTLNTPIEALEAEYPLRVDEYALRPDSGGPGRFRGGLGIDRSIIVEAPAAVSLLTERRHHAPSGAAGGHDGARGTNLIDGDVVPAKTTREVPAGTRVSVRTPGGGGYGPAARRDPAAVDRDVDDGKVTRDDWPEEADD